MPHMMELKMSNVMARANRGAAEVEAEAEQARSVRVAVGRVWHSSAAMVATRRALFGCVAELQWMERNTMQWMEGNTGMDGKKYDGIPLFQNKHGMERNTMTFQNALLCLLLQNALLCLLLQNTLICLLLQNAP